MIAFGCVIVNRCNHVNLLGHTLKVSPSFILQRFRNNVCTSFLVGNDVCVGWSSSGTKQGTWRKPTCPTCPGDHMTISHPDAVYKTRFTAVRGKRDIFKQTRENAKQTIHKTYFIQCTYLNTFIRSLRYIVWYRGLSSPHWRVQLWKKIKCFFISCIMFFVLFQSIIDNSYSRNKTIVSRKYRSLVAKSHILYDS